MRQGFLQLPNRGEGPCVSLVHRSTRSLRPTHALKKTRVRFTDVGMTSACCFENTAPLGLSLHSRHAVSQAVCKTGWSKFENKKGGPPKRASSFLLKG